MMQKFYMKALRNLTVSGYPIEVPVQDRHAGAVGWSPPNENRTA